MENIADSNSGLPLALSGVSTKLKQNLMLRNGSLLPLSSKATAENQELFALIKGLPFNNVADAIDGIVLKTGRNICL